MNKYNFATDVHVTEQEPILIFLFHSLGGNSIHQVQVVNMVLNQSNKQLGRKPLLYSRAAKSTKTKTQLLLILVAVNVFIKNEG